MGHRITRAASHLSVNEVKKRMSTSAHSRVRQRWWIIYNALVAPRKAEEIALHTGVSTTTVHRVIATYNRLGPAAVESPGKGGRRHQYLMRPEEEQFLAPFFAQAEKGEIATVAQIRHAFEERVGHEVDASTIYRLLHRHGLRKLMPRSRHPKADLQIQEQFKRIFPVQVEAAIATRETGDQRPVLIMAQHASLLWPHQPCEAMLGPSWSASSRTRADRTRVHLCLYRCGTNPWPDGLPDFAGGFHRDDESLLGGG